MNQKASKYHLPDGVSATLERVKTHEHPLDGNTLSNIWSLLEQDTQDIDASVVSKGSDYILNAIKSNRMQVYALSLSYNNGWPITAGAVTVLPTVHSHWDEKNNRFITEHAIYVEDAIVNPEDSDLFRTRTASPLRPQGMELAEFMLCELFRISAKVNPESSIFGIPSTAYITECGDTNDTITEASSRLFGDAGRSRENLYVMKLNKEPSFKRSMRTTVAIDNWIYETRFITCTNEHVRDNVMPKRIFSTSWRNITASEHIQMDNTLSISTFTGQDVFRIQITHSNQVPCSEKLVTVYGDMLNATAREILSRKLCPEANTIDDVFNLMHCHVKDTGNVKTNAQCMEALRTLGATERKLGTCLMRPVSLNYSQLDTDIFFEGRGQPVQFEPYRSPVNGVLHFPINRRPTNTGKGRPTITNLVPATAT